MSLNDWISNINWETFDHDFPTEGLSLLPESSSFTQHVQTPMESQLQHTEMIPQGIQTPVESQFQVSIPIFEDEASFENHVIESWAFISHRDDEGTSSQEMKEPIRGKRPTHLAKIMDFVVNGIPIPGIPIPGCTCTGTFRSCTRYDRGGWQSTCCTVRSSGFPLPMGTYRKGTRMGGRKMKRSTFERVLHYLISSGHNFTEAIDLKCFWGKHGSIGSLGLISKDPS